MNSKDLGRILAAQDAWDAACARSLEATLKMAGAQLVTAYSPNNGFSISGSKRDYWLATDIGLAMLVVRESEQQIKAIADWVAWHDVVDPEVRTDFLLFEEGSHETMRLTIQRPAMTLHTASNLEPLAELARAVMEHAGR